MGMCRLMPRTEKIELWIKLEGEKLVIYTDKNYKNKITNEQAKTVSNSYKSIQ